MYGRFDKRFTNKLTLNDNKAAIMIKQYTYQRGIIKSNLTTNFPTGRRNFQVKKVFVSDVRSSQVFQLYRV